MSSSITTRDFDAKSSSFADNLSFLAFSIGLKTFCLNLVLFDFFVLDRSPLAIDEKTFVLD